MTSNQDHSHSLSRINLDHSSSLLRSNPFDLGRTITRASSWLNNSPTCKSLPRPLPPSFLSQTKTEPLVSSPSGRGAVRVAKNYTKGYSDTQVKIRGATSNDPWGPSGAQMNEIAQMTYSQNEFVEVMEMLDKRLNDKGKNWRHVFKVSPVGV